MQQTELKCKIKRSNSLPNLNNYINSVKCVYCCLNTGLNKRNQSIQTDQIEIKYDNCSINESRKNLSVPRLCQQLTKDSGIEINQQTNSSNKSKSNSYSSTPTDLYDVCDLGIVSSSTRNNSVERQDSVINEQEFNEKETIINQVSKENDVLEANNECLIYNSSSNQIEKIGITKSESNELYSASNRRKVFKGLLKISFSKKSRCIYQASF